MFFLLASHLIVPSLIRSNAEVADASLISMPIDLRFIARATTLVVPLPRNGSRTKSPSFEQPAIIRRM